MTTNRERQMKIAILVPRVMPLNVVDPGFGGTERMCSQLIEWYTRLGHDVTVYAGEGSYVGDATLVPLPLVEVDSTMSYALTSFKSLSEVLNMIQPGQFQVLHNNIEIPLFQPPVPLVHHGHNGYNKGFRSWLRGGVSNNVHPVAISQSDQRQVEAGCGLQIPVVYNGIDVAALIASASQYSKGSEPYVALLGRCAPDKGFDLGIRACLEAGVKVKVSIPTPTGGEDEAFYAFRIKPHISSELVEVMGPLPTEAEKMRFFAEAALGMIPNRWLEPFGLIGVELMASGLTVVGPARGSLPEVLGSTGRLVDFDGSEGDEDAYVSRMAAAIRGAIDNPTPIQTCRQQALQFTGENMAKGYLNLFNQILS